MVDESMRARFTAALPWYVNDTLAADERAWVEDYLREHPQTQREVELLRLMREEIAAGAAERAPDAGLDELLRRIRAEAVPAPWWRRLEQWFRHAPLAPAFAFALILAQAGTIALLATQRHPGPDQTLGETRSAGAGNATGPVLRVSFQPDARESEIRRLLVRSGGRIVGGPGQLGGYLVTAASGRLDAALAELRASPLVDSVELLPRIPERAE